MQKGVLFFKMPWGRIDNPSVGLGILKTVLGRAGIPCDVVEAQMLILPWIRHSTYELFSYTRMLGEFVFTRELEEEIRPEQREALRKICHERETREVWNVTGNKAPFDPERLLEMTLRMRDEIVPAYFDALIDRLDLDRYALAGFNCVFDQTLASIAFARRIKRHRPDIVTAFGGAAFHGGVGTHWLEVFPEAVDVVASGDGEEIIVPLVAAVRGERPFAEVHNISFRGGDGRVVTTSHQNCRLSESPAPDYDDFFALLREMREVHGVRIDAPSLFVESSRGCWWGEKQHCTFCANDALMMSWRSKPAEVVLRDLEGLSQRYGLSRFVFVDEIMPFQYWNDLLPKLAGRTPRFDIFYEQKANLNESRIELLARAGVHRIQPGIESFSTPLLRKMVKGVTGIQNVFSLARCMQEGVSVYYNLLFGFPDDRPEEYEATLATLPALYHLTPPRHTSWIRLSRFSPLADRKERFGDYPLVPFWRYDLWFSEELRRARGLDLAKICFFYENPLELETPEDLQVIYTTIEEHFHRWRERFSQGAHLFYETVADGILISDGRRRPRAVTTAHGAVQGALLEQLSHGVATESRLAETLRPRFSLAEVAAGLEDLVGHRYVIAEEPYFASVVLPRSFYGSPERLQGMARMGYDVSNLETFRSEMVHASH